MTAKRSYDGPALDGREQHLSEAPYWGGGELTHDSDDEPECGVTDEDVDELDEAASETVYVTPAAPPGEERTENVPVPGEIPEDLEGQTTLGDWGLEDAEPRTGAGSE